MADCSVIIVSYQSSPVIFATLKCVLGQKALADVFVVDNGNSPAVLARLQQISLQDPRVKILTGLGNLGIAQANNLAARKADGNYFLFLQSDCILPPDALLMAVRALEKNQGAMVAGAWLLNADGSEQIAETPFLATPNKGLKHLLRFGYGYRASSFIPSDGFEVAAVSGVFMCISKEHFRLLGGFSEDYFLSISDLDLCRRVRNAGKKILLLPQIQAVHLHEHSQTSVMPSMLWHRAKGLMCYYKEHDSSSFPPFGRWFMNLMILINYGVLVKILFIKSWFRTFYISASRSSSLLRSRLLHFLLMGLIDLPQGQKLKDRQILLTGATGQVGLCVLRRLLAEGASVVALTRQLQLPFFHERVLWIRGDLTDDAFTLPDAQLDTVVHCAPLAHLPPHLSNFAGFGVKRIVAFGSTSLFSQATSKNWHEKEGLDRLRDAEKAIESFGQRTGVQWTILRPTLMYGMDMDNGIAWIMRFVRRFGFFPVYPPAMGKRHPVHVDDLAKAALDVLNNTATYNKSYNLSGGNIVNFYEMVERIFVACGRKKRIVQTTLLPFALDVIGKLFHKKAINAEVAYRMNDDLVFFNDSARDDFGFKPRGFLQELEE